MLHNMTSAMLIDKQLLECYWEFAETYGALICNSIAPLGTHAGRLPKSPMKTFTGVRSDTSVFKVFKCHEFAQMDKLQCIKNIDA